MNAVPRIPLSRPSITDAEVALVTDAIQNGWGDRCYDYIHRFEQAFADHVGVRHAIATSSCTGALHMGMAALGIGPGDEVILADTNWVASVAPVMYLGAQPVLVDVLPDTWCLDPQAVRAAISPRTKAIIAVHLYGNLCHMDELLALGQEFGIPVIEDAAEAMGSIYHGRRAGAMGAFGAFSFHGSKTMTTGEGGMVVTKHADLAARMKIMRLHGISRDAFDRFTSKTPAWYYEIVAPGFKYNMTDMAGALGRVQLKRLPAFVQRRQQLAQRYLEALQDLPLILPAAAPAGDTHAWHLFVLRLTDAAKVSRDAVIQQLSDAGIGTSVHYVPLHRQPYWRDRYSLAPEQFPQADKAYQRMFSIPLFTAMSDADQERIIAALRQILA